MQISRELRLDRTRVWPSSFYLYMILSLSLLNKVYLLLAFFFRSIIGDQPQDSMSAMDSIKSAALFEWLISWGMVNVELLECELMDTIASTPPPPQSTEPELSLLATSLSAAFARALVALATVAVSEPVPSVVVSGITSWSVEMSPIMPVRSQGQNSPRFQSRHAQQREQGWECWFLAPEASPRLQLCGMIPPQKMVATVAASSSAATVAMPNAVLASSSFVSGPPAAME
mmetsp:Transcript_36047/g.87018  ORF Transcript_36047/g.87018 Transcript_36047/m.87018 type:complete len:230 (-) Transcript_36047:849-1538(-)